MEKPPRDCNERGGITALRSISLSTSLAAPTMTLHKTTVQASLVCFLLQFQINTTQEFFNQNTPEQQANLSIPRRAEPEISQRRLERQDFYAQLDSSDECVDVDVEHGAFELSLACKS
jgi:hypothetical protein